VNYSIQFLPLTFKIPAGTSRGYLHEKASWILTLEKKGRKGIGEISVIEGLSPEFQEKTTFEKKVYHYIKLFAYFIEEKVDSTLESFVEANPDIKAFPSILFGLESAYLDLLNGGKQVYFHNEFTSGKQKIAINGLVWMGDASYMLEQVEDKITNGFNTIKLKVGALDWAKEIQILETIRKRYDTSNITIRLDANGAFKTTEVLEKLHVLDQFDIHSIEQPIKPGQVDFLAELCRHTPIPIALDEELIGIIDLQEKEQLLTNIKPQFIILKPSLHGGISGSKEWIHLAEKHNIDWWMTSALESNIGLNTIAQFAAEYQNKLPQGLGTGSLYTNNVASDLTIENGFIFKKNG
jgi:o-succinylbenzoate synthase